MTFLCMQKISNTLSVSTDDISEKSNAISKVNPSVSSQVFKLADIRAGYLACIWVVTIARQGWKFKVKMGQCQGLGLARMVMWSV